MLYGVVFLILIFLAGHVSGFVLAATFVLGFTVLHVAWFVLLQRRNGRTPGKAVAGIRVVDATGQVPGTGALVKRTIPLLIEYFYVIALVGILTSDYRQRFGDRWAGTYVIYD